MDGWLVRCTNVELVNLLVSQPVIQVMSIQAVAKQ